MGASGARSASARTTRTPAIGRRTDCRIARRSTRGEEARHYAALEAAAMTPRCPREGDALPPAPGGARGVLRDPAQAIPRSAPGGLPRGAGGVPGAMGRAFPRSRCHAPRGRAQEQRSLAARVLHLAREGDFAAAWRAAFRPRPHRQGHREADCRAAPAPCAMRNAPTTRARQDAACKELYDERAPCLRGDQAAPEGGAGGARELQERPRPAAPLRQGAPHPVARRAPAAAGSRPPRAAHAGARRLPEAERAGHARTESRDPRRGPGRTRGRVESA